MSSQTDTGDNLIMPNPSSRRLSLAVTLAGCVAATPAASAELSGPEIRQMIGGKNVRLNTPFGIALPLHYRDNGVVVGDVSGISAARMLVPREEGRWWISDDSLCQKWPSWYDGRQFCFRITSLGGGKIAWLRDDGASGTARIGP
ncbi:hypothetical protein [Kaistia hirudinis]